MKVAIVGAGIAGLAMHHALRKHLGDDIEIHIYEAYPAPTPDKEVVRGVGLGLAPNGIRALHSISPDSANSLESRGFTHSHTTLRNQYGTLLGHFPVGSAQRYGFAQRFISRADVHSALKVGIPDAAIQWETKVVAVEERQAIVRLVFEDWTDTLVDLVIGADGVKSVIAGHVMDDSQSAQYSGTVGIGGLIPIAELPERLQEGLKTDPVNMIFGLNGFFGLVRCDMSQTNVMWWSSFPTQTAPKRDLPIADIREGVLNRHASWKTPYDDSESETVFSALIEAVCKPDAKYPVLTLPRFHQYTPPPRRGSDSGRVVLVGDAAHTLPSESGQGVSCAIEDAVVYGQVLSFHLSRDPDTSVAFPDALKGYESVRKPRIEQVLARALRRQPSKKEMGWIRGWVRDWMMWMMCWFGEKLNDKAFSYDVNTDVQAYLDRLIGTV